MVTWPVLDACMVSRVVTDPSGPVLQTETNSPAVNPVGMKPIVVLTVVLTMPVVAATVPDDDVVVTGRVEAVVPVPSFVMVYLPITSWSETTPCAVICQLPTSGKVTVAVNLPLLSAATSLSGVTTVLGAVSHSLIVSPPLKPLPEKVTGAPSATGGTGENPVPPIVGTTDELVAPVVPTA